MGSNRTHTSDHKCITFKLNWDPIPPLLFRNPATTNWKYFTEIIEANFNNRSDSKNPQNEEEVDKMADSIRDRLIEAYETACPIRKHKAGKSLPYYTNEDRKQRTKTRRAFNECKKKTGNWTEYYKELRIYSKNLRIRDLVDSRLSIPNYVNTNQELINRIITEDRIIWAINTFKPLKSPGLDKIFPAMLQHSSETIVSLLCTLF